MSSGRHKSASADGSADVTYTVDVPRALAPDVHGEGTYTLYLCQITAHAAGRSVSWQVYKRFSHFCDLRETLFGALTDPQFKKKDRPEALVEAVELLPELPPKVYIGNSFAPAVVEERRAKLRTFLQMVVALPDAAHLAILQKFLRQPDEVLAADSGSTAEKREAGRTVTYSSARPWIVPRGPSAADLPDPDEWGDQARRGWRIIGCDSLYNGVYRLTDDGSETHCTNEHKRHLYLGPTGKWYLNSAFTPEADTCKAFYHKKKVSRKPSIEGIGLPLGEHRWQWWQAGAWEERIVRVEIVGTEAGDTGNLSSDPVPDRLIPETASASGRQSEAPNGSGHSKKAKGRFEQWLVDSQAASLSPAVQSGGGGLSEKGAEGLVPRAGDHDLVAESSDSEDGETVLVDHTPEALRRKKRKKNGGGCCGSRPKQEEDPTRKPAMEPAPEPEPAEEPDFAAFRKSFGNRGD